MPWMVSSALRLSRTIMTAPSATRDMAATGSSLALKTPAFLAKALDYMLTRWGAFTSFLDDGKSA